MKKTNHGGFFMAALVKDPENIRLGIIGMTEGNGHPYSWSAIFNSYDMDAMTRECPFPGIPEYLKKEGKLYFEIGHDQGAEVNELLKQAGFKEIHVVKDYAGLDRVVYATL
jgi:hypothetical protein